LGSWQLIILKSEFGWVQIDEGWLRLFEWVSHFMSTSEKISGLDTSRVQFVDLIILSVKFIHAITLVAMSLL